MTDSYLHFWSQSQCKSINVIPVLLEHLVIFRSNSTLYSTEIKFLQDYQNYYNHRIQCIFYVMLSVLF